MRFVLLKCDVCGEERRFDWGKDPRPEVPVDGWHLERVYDAVGRPNSDKFKAVCAGCAIDYALSLVAEVTSRIEADRKALEAARGSDSGDYSLSFNGYGGYTFIPASDQ